MRTLTLYPSSPRARGAIARVVLAVSALALVPITVSGCRKRSTTTTPGGVIATPQAHAAYITNNGSDSLSVIDRDGTAVTTIAVDVDPDEKEAPHHLAVDPISKSAFVALAFPAPPKPKKDPHAAHGNAESHGQLIRLNLANLAVTDMRELDHNPGEILLTHDRSKIIVTHFDMKRAMNVAAAGGTTGGMFASLQVWDAKDLTMKASRPLCVAPHGAVTSKDDTIAVVACYGSDELAVVDLTSPTLQTARYPLGTAQGVPGAPSYGPYSAILSDDGTRVVVATLEASDVRVFDMAQKKFLADKTVFLHARAFFPEWVSDHAVVVPLQAPDGLARIDIETATVEKRASFTSDVCKAPHVAKRAKDGRLYVVCEGDHVLPGTILEVDPTTLEVRNRWVVGVYPDGIAFGD